jgi:hypothetical protein
MSIHGRRLTTHVPPNIPIKFMQSVLIEIYAHTSVNCEVLFSNLYMAKVTWFRQNMN